MTGERFISAQDIAYRTGWHLMTIYRKAKNGEIPGVVKLGTSLRFKESEIEAWLSLGASPTVGERSQAKPSDANLRQS